MRLSGLTIEAKTSSMQIQFIKDNTIYATQDHFLFKSENGGENWDKAGRLPMPSPTLLHKIRDGLLRSKIVRTVRRNIGINDVVVLNSGTILIFYDKIYRLEKSQKIAEPVFSFSKNNMISPLVNGICITPEDGVFLGEYNCNHDPHKVKVLKGSNDGKEWETIYEFKGGMIRHIHSMRYDKYRKNIIICTGELNSEVSIFMWNQNSNELNRIGGGDQGWRAVSVIPTEECLFWGTDAGINNPEGPQNYIYKFDFSLNKRIKIQRIDNPAYFSTVLRNKCLIITTSYEGQKENPPHGSIWASTDGSRWEKMLSLKFNPQRNSSSNFGIIRIPNYIDEIDDLFFTPFNLKGHFNLFNLRFNL